MVTMHEQMQEEKRRVVELEKQLVASQEQTTHLTDVVQQVQVNAAAQSMQTPPTPSSSAPNPEMQKLLEQQRELITGYRELARAQAQRQASTPGSSTGPRLQIQMRPKEPPVFTGRKDQDVDTWLHQVEDYFELTKPSDQDGVAYLVLLLTGFARDWWEAEVKAQHGRQPATIEEMKMLMKAAFSSPLRERHARAEIRNLRQKPGEDYREYASRYKSLLARLPAGSYSDAIALDDWIFGLNPPYGERVMALKPKTLQEAISTMGELDIAHQFCRRDGKGQTSQTQSQNQSGGSGGSKKNDKGKKKFGGASGSGGGSGANKAGPSNEGSSGNKGNKFSTSSGKGGGPSDGSKSLKCFYCGKAGHKKSECRKFARDVQAKFAVLQAGVPASGSGAPSGAGRQPARKGDHPQEN